MHFCKKARCIGLKELFLLVLVLTTFAVLLTASSEYPPLTRGQSFLKRGDARKIHDEADPSEQQSCYSMGQMNIIYTSKEVGSPDVGLRVTDPRGRKIGYDLGADRGWQELPFAEAFFDCDENEDTGELRNCAGHIQICGPISGTYQFELLPTHNGKYSISVSARSQEMRDEHGFHSTGSQVVFKSDTSEQKPAILFLQYSREEGVQIRLSSGDQRMARREKSFTEKPLR